MTQGPYPPTRDPTEISPSRSPTPKASRSKEISAMSNPTEISSSKPPLQKHHAQMKSQLCWMTLVYYLRVCDACTIRQKGKRQTCIRYCSPEDCSGAIEMHHIQHSRRLPIEYLCRSMNRRPKQNESLSNGPQRPRFWPMDTGRHYLHSDIRSL